MYVCMCVTDCCDVVLLTRQVEWLCIQKTALQFSLYPNEAKHERQTSYGIT